MYFICIYRNIVEIDSQEYFLLHDCFRAVIWQFNVKEACVSFRKSLILILHRGHHRLDHEADVVALELLAVDRQSLLAPAETDDLQPINFRQLSHDIPEEFDSSRVFIQASWIFGVLLEQFDIYFGAAADDKFEFLASEAVEIGERD